MEEEEEEEEEEEQMVLLVGFCDMAKVAFVGLMRGVFFYRYRERKEKKRDLEYSLFCSLTHKRPFL